VLGDDRAPTGASDLAGRLAPAGGSGDDMPPAARWSA
jgi:hypothetical protein